VNSYFITRILYFLPYSWEHASFSEKTTLFPLLYSCSFLYAVFSVGNLGKGTLRKKKWKKL